MTLTGISYVGIGKVESEVWKYLLVSLIKGALSVRQWIK